MTQETSPAWIRKDFEHPDFAKETTAWFRRTFPPSKLRILGRNDGELSSLLIELPWPLTEEHGEWMEGWRPGNEDANDLSGWHEL